MSTEHCSDLKMNDKLEHWTKLNSPQREKTCLPVQLPVGRQPEHEDVNECDNHDDGDDDNDDDDYDDDDDNGYDDDDEWRWW